MCVIFTICIVDFGKEIKRNGYAFSVHNVRNCDVRIYVIYDPTTFSVKDLNRGFLSD